MAKLYIFRGKRVKIALREKNEKHPKPANEKTASVGWQYASGHERE